MPTSTLAVHCVIKFYRPVLNVHGLQLYVSKTSWGLLSLSTLGNRWSNLLGSSRNMWASMTVALLWWLAFMVCESLEKLIFPRWEWHSHKVGFRSSLVILLHMSCPDNWDYKCLVEMNFDFSFILLFKVLQWSYMSIVTASIPSWPDTGLDSMFSLIINSISVTYVVHSWAGELIRRPNKLSSASFAVFGCASDL